MNARMLFVALSLVVAAGAHAAPQPEARRQRESRPEQRAEQPEPGRMLRESIQRRIEMARRQQERLERAMSMLDGGASPDEMLAEFPELGRQRPGGPGEGGDFGPLGMPPEYGDGPGPDGQGPRGPGRGQRDPGLGGGREPMLDRPLTDDERAAVREFLRSAQPRLHSMFDELEKADPEEAGRKLREMFPRLRPLIEMRQRDPRQYEARLNELRSGREAMDSARRVVELERPGSGAAEADLAAARQALRAAVAAHIEARTEIRRLDLDRQIARAQTERQEMDSRSGERDSEIEAMVNRMIERERQRGDDGEHGHDDRDGRDGLRRPMRRGERP